MVKKKIVEDEVEIDEERKAKELAILKRIAEKEVK